jgi:hypothetical protein
MIYGAWCWKQVLFNLAALLVAAVLAWLVAHTYAQCTNYFAWLATPRTGTALAYRLSSRGCHLKFNQDSKSAWLAGLAQV